MLRCIGLEFRKNCYWPYVLLPVIGIVCLGFGNTVYDASGKSITLLELAGQLRAGVIAPDISFSAPVIWQQGLGSWLVLFGSSPCVFRVHCDSLVRTSERADEI